MVDHDEKIVNELGLPYRVLDYVGVTWVLPPHAYDFELFYSTKQMVRN